MDVQYCDLPNRICLIRLKGRFQTGCEEVSRAARERIRAMDCRAVVVNCRDVPYIDSTGMGCLVSLFTTLRNAGGAFALAEANERTRSVLALTKLDTVFPIYDTETQALNAVSEQLPIARMGVAAGQSW